MNGGKSVHAQRNSNSQPLPLQFSPSISFNHTVDHHTREPRFLRPRIAITDVTGWPILREIVVVIAAKTETRRDERETMNAPRRRRERERRGEKREAVFSARRKTKIGGGGRGEGGICSSDGRLLPVWRGPIERRR